MTSRVQHNRKSGSQFLLGDTNTILLAVERQVREWYKWLSTYQDVVQTNMVSRTLGSAAMRPKNSCEISKTRVEKRSQIEGTGAHTCIGPVLNCSCSSFSCSSIVISAFGFEAASLQVQSAQQDDAEK
jgi:hypothetical protein